MKEMTNGNVAKKLSFVFDCLLKLATSNPLKKRLAMIERQRQIATWGPIDSNEVTERNVVIVYNMPTSLTRGPFK